MAMTLGTMTPTLIGYFPKYTLRRGPDFAPPQPGIEELANLACASPEPATLGRNPSILRGSPGVRLTWLNKVVE
jgi:hypothetical protein